MKTSEFIRYVKENWLITWEQGDNVINISPIMKVHTNRQLIEFEKRTASSKLYLTLIKKAIEYTETPLEERQEEKKYRLKSKLLGFDDGKDLHLIYSAIYEQYCLASNISQPFTQKEIDAMPFDTSFFIKEEVK